MTSLPSRESILDDAIITSDWKAYYGDIRDYVSLLPFAQVANEVTIVGNSITVNSSANKILAESNSPTTVDNIKTDGLQDSQLLLLYKGNEEHNISLKNGSVGDGSIATLENKDIPLSMDFPIILQRDGNNWKQIDLIGSMRATDEDIDEGTSKIKFPTVEQMKPYMGTAISAQLGVVIYSMKPAVGCLECNDTEHQGNTYKTLYAAIVDGTLPSVSYEEYQSQSSSSGFCEKFGLDSDNGKFKCPNLSSVKFGETTYKAYVGAWNTAEKNVMDLQGILDQCLVVQKQVNEKGEEIVAYVNQSLQDLADLRDTSIQEITDTKTQSLEEITTQETTSLANIEQKRVDSVNSVEAKRLEITSVGQGEIDKLNALSTSLTNSFNTNAQEKQASVDASADEAEEWANKSKEYADKAQFSSFGNIGDIKYTLRKEVPNGGVWCDGTEYTKAQFPDVYQMLVDGKLQSTTVSAFDSTVSANGSCGFFGLDTSNERFKVPMLKDVYLKAGQAPIAFGAESLPNIKGTFGMQNEALGRVTGAFKQNMTKQSPVRGAGIWQDSEGEMGFDASLSSSTYQDGAKVNPDHIVYRAYVVLYSQVMDVPSSVDKALIWAEGTDEQVQSLGGTKSAKGWAEASENLNYQDIINCITKIPQDIKLELNDGTLIVKAGTKVYVPNGVGVFDEVTIQNDVSVSGWYEGLTDKCSIAYRRDGSSGVLIVTVLSKMFSGASQPSTEGQWYDTTNNLIKESQDGSSWKVTDNSLPLCIVTFNNNVITSIDQIFNGFGYIGSTIFALPGVEGLIPNGRNTDGSLNNTKFTTTSVLTTTVEDDVYNGIVLSPLDNTMIPTENIYYFEQSNKPNEVIGWWYNTSENKCYRVSEGNWELTEFPYIKPITYIAVSSKITSFSPKNVFQAVDRNDSEWASTAGKPSDRYVDLPVGATGSKYIAPANGQFVARGDITGNTGLMLINTIKNDEVTLGSMTFGFDNTYLNIPVAPISVKKGDAVLLQYARANVTMFRFFYDEGAN